ncbi:MAG TPA: amidohydrolase family protein [Gaiellaceae bacterium]|nr:amidohydrolase family protein [Gaiellaceae bacterium]
MTDLIDLTDVPVIDNHCHAVEADQTADVSTWRRFFTESPDPAMRSRDVVETAFYRRLIRAMGEHFGVSGEESVLEVRAAHTTEDLVSSMFRDASISGVVIDTGYPAPDKAMPAQAFRSASQARRVSLLRLEVLFQQLVAERAAYDDLVDAVRDELADVRRSGFAGFKSVVGYRTGLSIERWRRDDARAAFTSAREDVERSGAVRLGYKPLLDTLLHLAFEAAAAQELPVQFHVGYGDPDADLRKASPLELRNVLEERAYRSMPVVLLHGCWPYVREGAYLAAVYGNAYLDVSYAIPFLSRGEMLAMTRAALAAAPFTKVMYSSDGARVPELHWLGAHDGRRALAVAVGELVADGDLDAVEARRAGERILRGNAHELYGFAGEASS